MTEQTITLKGEQWKQLALLSYAQLQKFLGDLPPQTETGESGLTDQHLALIDAHLAEARLFLRSWRAARIAMPQAEQPAQQAANGTEPKRRGGWPKGKKRNAPNQAVQ